LEHFYFVGESYNPKISRTLPEPSRSKIYNSSNSQRYLC